MVLVAEDVEALLLDIDEVPQALVHGQGAVPHFLHHGLGHHHVLDGLHVVLVDQHAPAVVTNAAGICVVVLRYTNSTLRDMIDNMIMPLVREGMEFESLDKGGITDLLKEAMKKKMEIHMAVSSGTSLLTEGPVGYTMPMDTYYTLTQSDVFKLGRGKDDKSKIVSILFYQSALPNVDYV